MARGLSTVWYRYGSLFCERSESEAKQEMQDRKADRQAVRREWAVCVAQTAWEEVWNEDRINS